MYQETAVCILSYRVVDSMNASKSFGLGRRWMTCLASARLTLCGVRRYSKNNSEFSKRIPF